MAVQIYLMVAAALGAFFNVWQENGYSMLIFWQGGVLQMGVVMSFVTGIGGAILALASGLIPITGDPVVDIIVTFFMAFMFPFAISTLITKSPYGNTEATSVQGKEGV